MKLKLYFKQTCLAHIFLIKGSLPLKELTFTFQLQAYLPKKRWIVNFITKICYLPANYQFGMNLLVNILIDLLLFDEACAISPYTDAFNCIFLLKVSNQKHAILLSISVVHGISTCVSCKRFTHT